MILIILVLLLCIYFLYFYQPITPVGNEAILTVYMVDGKIKEHNNTSLNSTSTNNTSVKNPKVSGTPIDLDNTGEFALFVGGQNSDDDALLIQRNGKWIDLIDQTNLRDPTAKHTYSSVSADLDHNGYTDLVIARDNGVKLYLNQGRGRFIVRELTSKSDNVIPVGLAITDFDKDGHPDIYVSQFTHPDLIRNGSPDEENYLDGLGSNINKQDKNQQPNQQVEDLMLKGLGTGAFKDSTHENNLDRSRKHGSRNPIFIDLNRDRLPDLVLTNDVGELEVYQNTRGASGLDYAKGSRFKKIKVPTGMGYWNNISPLINENGKVGLKLSDPSTNQPSTNQSANQSTNQPTNQQTKQQHIKLPSGSKNKSIDHQPTEINHSFDLKAGWNILMESVGLTNAKSKPTGQLEHINLENKWVNIAGPTQSFKKNWIGVRLPDSSPYLNATIYVESYNTKTRQIHRQNKQNLITSSEDQSKIVYFDLGDDNKVTHLEVNTIYDGNTWIHPRPMINMITTFRSMLSTPYTAN